jgi:hypothetical protein
MENCKSMHLHRFFLYFLSIAIFSGCKKDNSDRMLIQGVVRDEASFQPVPGITISIDAIKSSSGWGILADGRRETIGEATTDANGYYKVKLNVFPEAERLEFYLNYNSKEGYVCKQEGVYLSNLNRNGSSTVDFTLDPTAFLKIKFRNTTPVSDRDSFYFRWDWNSTGWPNTAIQKENCGTVLPDDGLWWIGKDVCGTYTVGTIAEKKTFLSWTVKKSGSTQYYRDSIYIQRGILNQYILNY